MSGGANRRAPGLVLRLERPGRKARGSLPPAAPTSRLQTTPRALLSGGSSRSRPYLFIVPFPRPTKRAAGLAVLPLQRGCPLPPTGAAPSAPRNARPAPLAGSTLHRNAGKVLVSVSLLRPVCLLQLPRERYPRAQRGAHTPTAFADHTHSALCNESTHLFPWLTALEQGSPAWADAGPENSWLSAILGTRGV